MTIPHKAFLYTGSLSGVAGVGRGGDGIPSTASKYQLVSGDKYPLRNDGPSDARVAVMGGTTEVYASCLAPATLSPVSLAPRSRAFCRSRGPMGGICTPGGTLSTPSPTPPKSVQAEAHEPPVDLPR